MAPYFYEGELERDGELYRGQLRDASGWVIFISAEVVEVNGSRKFRLKGELGPTPPELILPFENEMREPE